MIRQLEIGEKEQVLLAQNESTQTVHVAKEHTYDEETGDFDTLCGNSPEGLVVNGDSRFVDCETCLKRMRKGYHKSGLVRFVEETIRGEDEEAESFTPPPWFDSTPADNMDELAEWLFYILEVLDENIDNQFYKEKGWYPPGIEYNQGMRVGVFTALNLMLSDEELVEHSLEEEDEQD